MIIVFCSSVCCLIQRKVVSKVLDYLSPESSLHVKRIFLG